MTTVNTKTHSLLIGKEQLGIYHEHKRLYKFMSWKSSSPILKKFLLRKITEANPTLKKVEGLDVTMESVNPMRRSMFGNFYLDVKGEVLDSDGMVIANFLDLNIKHVALEGYHTHDEEEKRKRSEVEETFGKDQYSKELCIRTQAVDELLVQSGGTLELNSGDTAGIDNFIQRCMELTGWTNKEDNRIHSRIKRLPPYMEVPE